MNTTRQIPSSNQSGSALEPGAAEETLRLIAHLPVPAGLEDRVHAKLLLAPRKGRILAWPVAPGLGSSWMRSAAAAAIVFVVAGGGWGIYSGVQQPVPSRAAALPPHVAAQGGFSSAGAMRTPQTLNGPVLAHPVTAQPVQAKPAAHTAKKPAHRVKPSAVGKSAAQPASPPAN
ncbi:MAG: hypothetical protein ABR956_09135 [Terracidiphilus sp.]|jgi:hypothetical protein